MTLWQYLFKRKPVRYKIVQRDITRLKPQEWRTNPALVTIAKKFLSNSEFWLLLDCVRNEHPDRIMFMPGADITERALHQARIEGFMMCLNTLESLGTPAKVPEEIEATYESPDADMRPEDTEHQ